jgi:group I intron endonuclease
MGYIYLVTNLVNGMKYVGQTRCTDIETRWKQHRLMRKESIGRYLLNAYSSYGIYNFSFKIICICFDEDCDIYESEYIKKYITLYPNGYNLKEGGHFTKHHESTKALMSQKTKEMMTDSYKQYLSQKLKSVYHPNRGRKLTEERKQKISISMKLKWKNATPEEKLKLLGNRSKPTVKQGGDTNHLRLGREKHMRDSSRAVCKYSKENILLSTYSSISEAARANNLAHSTISRVCNENPNYKTGGGFIWKFI